jgi:hypothetical protein
VPRGPDRPRLPEDAVGQQDTVGRWPTADRRPASDQPALSERPAPWSREGLRQRLERLPDWHPSSLDQPDRPGGNRDGGRPDAVRVRPEPSGLNEGDCMLGL